MDLTWIIAAPREREWWVAQEAKEAIALQLIGIANGVQIARVAQVVRPVSQVSE